MSYSMLEFVARTLLVLPLLHSAIACILGYQANLDLMQSKNLPYRSIALPAAIALKVFGSLAVLFNIYTAIAAGALALFTLIATVIFHGFWQFEGGRRQGEAFAFTTSIGVVGGLMFLMIYALYP